MRRDVYRVHGMMQSYFTRYVAHRSPRLDAVLEHAGIVRLFADHVARAGSIPDYREPPRPALNRPFPPADA